MGNIIKSGALYYKSNAIYTATDNHPPPIYIINFYIKCLLYIIHVNCILLTNFALYVTTSGKKKINALLVVVFIVIYIYTSIWS